MFDRNWGLIVSCWTNQLAVCRLVDWKNQQTGWSVD